MQTGEGTFHLFRNERFSFACVLEVCCACVARGSSALPSPFIKIGPIAAEPRRAPLLSPLPSLPSLTSGPLLQSHAGPGRARKQSGPVWMGRVTCLTSCTEPPPGSVQTLTTGPMFALMEA